jgi:Xaa-Pro aminopeptidase
MLSERPVVLKQVELPHNVPASTWPTFGLQTFVRRIARLRALMDEHGYSHLAVFGDPWTFANLNYLLGFDPRLEPMLLVVGRDDPLFLLAGNEGLPYSNVSPLPAIQRRLCHLFSLPGQPLPPAPSLDASLAEAGIGPGARVGVVGTRYYPMLTDGEYVLDVPAHLADGLRRLAGPEQVRNATDLLIHPGYGLRTAVDADEIAFMDHSAQWVNAGVCRLLALLRPGLSELEATRALDYPGHIPLANPIVLGWGDNALAGITGPLPDNPLQVGQPIQFSYNLWGANVVRAGLALRGPQDLPEPDALEAFYIPYFRAKMRWYETLALGVTGGDLYAAVADVMEDPRFGAVINPGHLIHWDEWTSAFIDKGSAQPVRSGMPIQAEILCVPGPPYHMLHVEDGLIVADDALRRDLAARHPQAAANVARRRDQMQRTLGITLAPEILPMSEIQAWLFPFLLDPSRILAFAE